MAEPDLRTDCLRLRLIDSRDADTYRALYTSPEVMRHVMPPLSVEAADAGFASVCRHNQRAAPGHRHWAIEDVSQGTALGLVALQRDGARAELGVLLLPHAWRRRVASEAFVPVLAYGFRTMGLAWIDAERADDPHARVIDRLLVPFGFERIPARSPGACRWALPVGRWSAPG